MFSYRILKSLLAAFVCTATLVACGGGDDPFPSTPKLNRIEVKADRLALPAGETTKLYAIAHYSDGAAIDVTDGNSGGRSVVSISWAVSAQDVGQLDNSRSNTLKALKAGTVTVTATDFFSKVSGQATVTVTAPSQTRLSINGLSDGQTISARTAKLLTASFSLTDGTAQQATSVTWTSSNPAVAEVDAAGNFRGKGAGTTTIGAAAGSFNRAITVTLAAPVATPTVVISCDPSRPTVIDSAQWNIQTTRDPSNVTEWVVVDGPSCQANAAVGLYVSSNDSSGLPLYNQRFVAARSPSNPTVFEPGSTSGTALLPTKVTIGSKTYATAATFTSLYEVQAR